MGTLLSRGQSTVWSIKGEIKLLYLLLYHDYEGWKWGETPRAMVEKVLKGPDISATRFQPLILSVSLICYKRHIVFTKSLLDKLKEIRNYSKPRCLKHTFLWFSHHNKRFLTLSSLFFDILILSVLECLDCLGNHPFSRFQEHPTQFITNLVSQRATSHLLFFFFRLFLWNSVECSIFVLGWTINLTFLLWYTVLCHLVIHIWNLYH